MEELLTQPVFSFPDVKFTESAKMNVLQFDPSRASIALVDSKEAASSGIKIAWHQWFVLKYRKKGGWTQDIMVFGFDIHENKMTGTQLQWMNTPKAKDFFHSLDIPKFWLRYCSEFCQINKLYFSIKPDSAWFEDLTDNARRRYSELMSLH